MDCEGLDDTISMAAAELGYPVVKDEQREAVKEFMKGRDAWAFDS